MSNLTLRVGVKTDPIECRYSFPWLFALLADEGIQDVQIGTFFELYQLPDEFFHDLRRSADQHGVRIHSMFTAHRELGGFYRHEPGFVQVARRNYERLIEIGGILGAASVGSNPGAVLRDRMADKPAGQASFIRHMKDLLRHARRCGLRFLTVEPMSCLAEPPTLPGEIAAMMDELAEFHECRPGETARIGLCADVSHGYADIDRNIVFGHMEIMEACIPYLYEVHLKNTDAIFSSTFGFSEAERARGIVDLRALRDLLLGSAATLPVDDVVGYLEIGGPKTGRDYSDHLLERSLRESLAHCREAFASAPSGEPEPTADAITVTSDAALSPPAVLISPSMMCADMRRLEEDVRRIEAAGADMLHFDIMDAGFTPNMPIGLVVLEHLRRSTSLPFDVHLMVEDNDFFVRQVARLGANWISVHVESAVHLDRTLTMIRDLGAMAGAALNPATPVSRIQYVLDRLDFVLVMTVNPGYAGQALVPTALRKIADCRALLDGAGRRIPLEVDGNVSFDHIPKMVAAGADILVAGTSSVFKPGSALHANMRRTREAAAEGLRLRRPAE